MEELVKAKVILYNLLLQIKVELLTDTEVELMFQLSQDKQIKELLSKVLK